jgi:hypothetical protein
MENYIPLIINVNPLEIIPHHQPGRLREGILLDYLGEIYVPPIPLVESPEDLKPFGNYINYNGHHRTCAARRALELRKGFEVQGILLRNDGDLDYLNEFPPRYNGEIYPELIEDLDLLFEEHRSFIWNEARRFHKLLEIAKEKGIPWGY